MLLKQLLPFQKNLSSVQKIIPLLANYDLKKEKGLPYLLKQMRETGLNLIHKLLSFNSYQVLTPKT
jgi:hypothetical protein